MQVVVKIAEENEELGGIRRLVWLPLHWLKREVLWMKEMVNTKESIYIDYIFSQRDCLCQ